MSLETDFSSRRKGNGVVWAAVPHGKEGLSIRFGWDHMRWGALNTERSLIGVLLRTQEKVCVFFFFFPHRWALIKAWDIPETWCNPLSSVVGGLLNHQQLRGVWLGPQPIEIYSCLSHQLLRGQSVVTWHRKFHPKYQWRNRKFHPKEITRGHRKFHPKKITSESLSFECPPIENLNCSK